MASKYNIKQPPIYNVDALDAKLEIKLKRDKKQVDLFFDEIKDLVIAIYLTLDNIKLSLAQSHIYHSDVSFNEKLKKICGDVICHNLTIIGIENKFTFFHFKIPGSNSIKQAVESANDVIPSIV